MRFCGRADYIGDVIFIEGVGQPQDTKLGRITLTELDSAPRPLESPSAIDLYPPPLSLLGVVKGPFRYSKGILRGILRLARAWVAPLPRQAADLGCYGLALRSGARHLALRLCDAPAVARTTGLDISPWRQGSLALSERPIDLCDGCARWSQRVAPRRRSSNRLHVKVPRNATHAKNLRPGTFRNSGCTELATREPLSGLGLLRSHGVKADASSRTLRIVGDDCLGSCRFESKLSVYLLMLSR